jgi:hypothetical protein
MRRYRLSRDTLESSSDPAAVLLPTGVVVSQVCVVLPLDATDFLTSSSHRLWTFGSTQSSRVVNCGDPPWGGSGDQRQSRPGGYGYPRDGSECGPSTGM